jgi:hypothetical protein
MGHLPAIGAPGEHGYPAGGWLTFQSGDQCRRLLPAPVGWFEESEDRLRHWLGLAQTAKPRLQRYERSTAAANLPLARDDSPRRIEPLQVSPPTEDVRSRIERSRQTLDELDRAIGGKVGPIGDPPGRRRS